MKFFVNLVNVDLVIRNEDKSLILLSSLSDERYKTFVLTLINERISLSYIQMTTALVNLKLRWKYKESFSGTSAEALTVKGRSLNQRGGNRGRSKLRSRFDNCSFTWDYCAFYKQNGHWKKKCPELKKKNKLKEKSIKPSEVPSQMKMSMILLLSRSLLHHLYATQMRQNGYWIRGLPIIYVPEENDFLS